MKDNCIISIVGMMAYIIITTIFIILAIDVINDLKQTAQQFKRESEICRQKLEECLEVSQAKTEQRKN